MNEHTISEYHQENSQKGEYIFWATIIFAILALFGLMVLILIA